MKKTAQQSLLDTLLQIMPNLQLYKDDQKNKKIANDHLYSIWSQASKMLDRKVVKPKNLDDAAVAQMKSAGYIEEHGNYIKITEKGAQALKISILNDNTFALNKKASTNTLGWYDKLKHENYLS
jgi:CTP-dependent riboflavin kinase